MRASHLAGEMTQRADSIEKAEITDTLWGEFGYLCYDISTKPTDGAAVSSNLPTVRELWSRRWEKTRIEDGLQNSHAEIDRALRHAVESERSEKRASVLRLGAYCFRKAAALDKYDWKYPFMIARIYAKLEGKPEVRSFPHE